MYLCTRRVVLFYAHYSLPALFLLKIVPRITSHRQPRKMDGGSPRITAHHPLPDVFLLRKMRGVTRITAHHRASPRITPHHLASPRFFYRSVEARSMTMEDAYQVKITLQSRAPNVDSNSLTWF